MGPREHAFAPVRLVVEDCFGYAPRKYVVFLTVSWLLFNVGLLRLQGVQKWDWGMYLWSVAFVVSLDHGLLNISVEVEPVNTCK
jgi:hypothetical protein